MGSINVVIVPLISWEFKGKITNVGLSVHSKTKSKEEFPVSKSSTVGRLRSLLKWALLDKKTLDCSSVFKFSIIITTFIDPILNAIHCSKYFICIHSLNLITMRYKPLLQASLVAQRVKNLPAMQETRVQFLAQESPLEKGMATHFSVIAWRITWTAEPGQLWVAKIWTQLNTHTCRLTILLQPIEYWVKCLI